MKAIIIENDWLTRSPRMDFGWGNGYVLIPIGHKLHGVNYNEIDVQIHGGITYSELIEKDTLIKYPFEVEDIGKWMVGFDTVHYGDTLQKWPKEKVQEEADKLLNLLINY